MHLSGNTVFITGGGSGIGLALARALLVMDNAVIICGRNRDKLERVKAEHPAIETVLCDVTRDEEVASVVDDLTRTFPDLNVLVNNAGLLLAYQFHHDHDALSKIEQEITTNLTAPAKLTKRLLPQLMAQPAAAVVNVSSGLAHVPWAPAPVYSATKAGLHFFSRVLRRQLRGTSVKVFEVLPPPVDTEMVKAFQLSKIGADELADEALKGMARDKYEIRVGISKSAYVMSRLAPGFIEDQLAKT